jgi:superfamily I DNA/RNA helicase
MDTVVGIELTDEQTTAAGYAGGDLRIRGATGTGKTTTLLARYVGLLESHPPSELLVVCRNRAGAERFRDTVIDHLAGGFDWLPITTFAGLAFDVAVRHGEPVELLTWDEQVDEVARLLGTEGRFEWPTLHRYLGRRAFTEQVARALIELDTNLLSEDDVRGRSPRWAELCAFAARYRASLRAAGTLDFAGLAARAARLLDDPVVGAAEDGRYRHLLVDDYGMATVAEARLVSQRAALGASVTVAAGAVGAGPGDFAPTLDVALTRCFRSPGAPRLVVCNHPSIEGEAIAGELLAAREEGRGWGDIAVLVRSLGPRSDAIVRALVRHGIPVDIAGGARGNDDEPVVRAIVDMLRWADGDGGALDRVLASPVSGLDPSDVHSLRGDALRDGAALETDPRLAHLVTLRDDLATMAPAASPADLAFEVWRRALGHLADETADGAHDDAVDAVVDFIGALERRAARRPTEGLADFLAVTAGRVPGRRRLWPRQMATKPAVTISSIANAAGREWNTVVVAGCVEGEVPRLGSPASLFGPWLDRTHPLVDERRLFESACHRAIHQLVGTVTAEPGVLPSRFVESWATSEPQSVPPPGRAATHLSATVGIAPACPDGHLSLSASRLSTYDDCPLRFAYEYVLGARSDSNVWAAIGTLVHRVLAQFLDPDDADACDLSRERLLAIAEGQWRDDIAPYRPQLEEIRRDFFSMLGAWWAARPRCVRRCSEWSDTSSSP